MSLNQWIPFFYLPLSWPASPLVCAASLSSVWLFVTPWTVAHQAPLSMGILQARILEWVAMPFSSRPLQPRDPSQVSHFASRFFTIWATRKAQWLPQGTSRWRYIISIPIILQPNIWIVQSGWQVFIFKYLKIKYLSVHLIIMST